MRPIKDYIDIGQRYDPEEMLAQLEHAILLTGRDRAILSTCGWIDEDTEAMMKLREELAGKTAAYRNRHGSVPARQKTLRSLVDRAKRWRMQALAIGRNALRGEELRTLEMLSRPTYGDLGLLSEVVQGLLLMAEQHKGHFSQRGATAEFLEEGQQVLDALKSAARGDTEEGGKANGADEAAAAARELEELCGRGWEALKKLNRSGRAAQLLRGNRLASSEYNLDILMGRLARDE